MFNFSLEAMQAVLQSRFGKELDAIWQEIIDYRDTSLADMSYNGKLSALKKFFRDNTAKKLVQCVWKNVGLHFTEVKITSLYTGSFCTWIYIDKDGKELQDGTLQIEGILNADYIKRFFPIVAAAIKDDHFTAEELMKIANSYDASSGAIKDSMKLQIRKFVNPTLGFDLELAFMLEDQLAKNSGLGNFTAREITAIILHEIGHTLTLVEHAGDAYARMASFNYLTSAFRKVNVDKPDQAIRLAEAVAVKVGKMGDSTNSDRLSKIANQLRNDINKAGASADPTVIKKTIAGMFETVFCFLNDIIMVPLDVLFGSNVTKRLGNDQSGKKSDLPLNRRLVTWQERKADEYAFTHGYGADQVSALDRLGKFFNRRGLSEKACRTLTEAENLHKDIGFFAKLHLLTLAPLYAGDYGYSLYPEGAKRFRELLNLTIQQIKQHCTDPEYVAKYMKDADYILSVVDNPDSRDEFIARLYRGYDIFMKYCSLPSFLDWLVNGRVKRELEEVLNDANDIGNNLLTYFGLKIQQMAK